MKLFPGRSGRRSTYKRSQYSPRYLRPRSRPGGWKTFGSSRRTTSNLTGKDLVDVYAAIATMFKIRDPPQASPRMAACQRRWEESERSKNAQLTSEKPALK